MNILKYPFMLLRILRRLCLRVLNGNTLGVHAMVINEKKEILLVRLTYAKGWFFPGGGVDSGETLEESMRRELMEEVGVTVLDSSLELFGVYHHLIWGMNDYPILFIIKNFTQVQVSSPEIAEAKWFKINEIPVSLPDPISSRIKEYFSLVPKSGAW